MQSKQMKKGANEFIKSHADHKFFFVFLFKNLFRKNSRLIIKCLFNKLVSRIT